MSKDVVRTEAAPAPFQGAPYSQAIRAGGLVFVSGQLALRPGDTAIVGRRIAEQTEQVLTNLRAILEAAGTSLDNVVKTTVFLAEPRRLRRDERRLRAATSAIARPRASTVEVAKLPSGALVEIEAIALATP